MIDKHFKYIIILLSNQPLSNNLKVEHFMILMSNSSTRFFKLYCLSLNN